MPEWEAFFFRKFILLLLLELQNVLRGIGKAYVESLNSRSVLPPDPPLWVKLGS